MNRIIQLLTTIIRFVTYDVWRITEREMTSRLKRFAVFIVKSICLAFRGFINEALQTKASALTYSTLLAIVPLLAVLVGVASGFGMKDSVRQSLYDYLPGQRQILDEAFRFAENYLSVSQGGLFIGVGIVLLLYTVISLISTIENTFNDIWQIKKPRSWRRKITDYLSFIIILPAIMTVSSGLSLLITTFKAEFLQEYVFMTPVANTLFKIAPYFLASLFFTVLFILIPNTKVRFFNALAAGILTGCAFQLLQYLYISGQIGVSKYNAIYGSFAALPLMLVWLQLSWVLILFGAEIAYASQNLKEYNFEKESKNISRRYRDFLSILITSLIVKRFEHEDGVPYTADEMSDENQIPVRLTTEILYELVSLNILCEVMSGDDERIVRFQPALDINKLTIGYLLRKIDEKGNEDFKIDSDHHFGDEWKALITTRETMFDYGNKHLLKDL
ncbi:MAG: YihY/virulence factor BrkB family protein [Tannerella sp.]|jgi:membrane protein|nr:YihY/virulence factor BrkB family protein [Tannerella sp.]